MFTCPISACLHDIFCFLPYSNYSGSQWSAFVFVFAFLPHVVVFRLYAQASLLVGWEKGICGGWNWVGLVACKANALTFVSLWDKWLPFLFQSWQLNSGTSFMESKFSIVELNPQCPNQLQTPIRLSASSHLIINSCQKTWFSARAQQWLWNEQCLT